MAELADALASGASSRKGVEVRVLFRAPRISSLPDSISQLIKMEHAGTPSCGMVSNTIGKVSFYVSSCFLCRLWKRSERCTRPSASFLVICRTLEQWKYRAGFKRIDGSVSLGKMAMAMQTQAECCWQGLNGQNQSASTAHCAGVLPKRETTRDMVKGSVELI